VKKIAAAVIDNHTHAGHDSFDHLPPNVETAAATTNGTVNATP